MWTRFRRKRTGRIENVRERFGQLKTPRQGRAYSGNTAVGLGIGVLALLTIGSLTIWLLRRRARETAPVAPPPEEEGAASAPPEEEEAPPSQG